MLISIVRKDKEAAIKLRLSGKSYTQILSELGVPKSTLSGWLANLVISPEARAKINSRAKEKSREGLLKRNRNQTRLAIARAKGIRSIAAAEIKRLSQKELKILGAALYWAEGYKRPIYHNGRELTHHPISLTNSDPDMVKAFLMFLRESLDVPNEKIKASIRIYNHQNEKELLRFWQEATGIPQQNFNKTYYGVSKSSLGKRPFNRLQYGVIQIIVGDTKLFHRTMGYIEGLKKLV